MKFEVYIHDEYKGTVEAESAKHVRKAVRVLGWVSWGEMSAIHVEAALGEEKKHKVTRKKPNLKPRISK